MKPLPCLMPLYGNGLRRTSVLRVAAWINDVLSCKRNEGVRPERHLPATKVISAEETRERFPSVDLKGLQGGVIWYDACMPDSQLIVIELLRWSFENGTTALNYMEACQLLKAKKSVAGVIALDSENGEAHEFKTSVVVNVCGPWCRDVAACFGTNEPDLFKGSLAWNVLFNKESLSSHALAVSPKKPRARTYFILPWKGKLLAGTGHAPWFKNTENAKPSAEQIQKFMDDLNHAVPFLEVSQKDILHIFSGLLPATEVGGVDLAVRETILNHADYGGPQGFYSISGVKFTTARLVAEKTLKTIFSGKEVKKVQIHKDLVPFQVEVDGRRSFSFDLYPLPQDRKWKQALRSIIQEEAVQHLDDLIYRRTTLWENPKKAFEIAPSICDLFQWDESR
ncbi:FAD-dependent oxidoreductase, partial [bacterium]|nr:FAD-dependent oxidoreductase [bacterium]